jgi:hypothetical protein
LLGERIGIGLVVDDLHHAGADQQLRAVDARLMRAVGGRVLEAHAVQGALNHGVCLGVRGAQAVIVDEGAADLGAVRDAARRAVISRREDAVLAN